GEARDVQVLRADSSKVKASLTLEPNGIVTLSFRPDTLEKGQISLSGVAGAREWSGRGTLPDGSWIDWRAEMAKPAGPDKPSRQKPEERPETGAVIYPFIAYGRQEIPRAETVLIRNATVWTNEKAGILQNTDVLVSEGKIQKIGKRLAAKEGVLVVDGSGKHLTAGIIDEHSHIAAVRGINEGTQESSAEVRIGDVINSEDNDIYLQLAGGVTSSHILHGSANPIGGQTQLIKLRWGRAPEELKFQNWPGFIKFALGENVKQSNNSNSNNRYPQTRMGVEQTYVDYFTRAKEYGQLKKSGKPYRTDLELEALLEILESRRFITCHSYVQSEITMLMRVAEHFGFRVNTFTHILEG
ncbi:MAG: amidohydrolase, partial [Saprospiraceae bacterium]|nr:amidohydrolase [Saprospiraceae bacterium]